MLSVDGKGCCKIKRFAESRLGASTYSAKLSDIYNVPGEFDGKELPPYPDNDEDQDFVQGTAVPVDTTVAVTAHPEDQNEEDVCSTCLALVDDDDQALTCDTCQKWCHILCGNVSNEVYEHLTSNEDVSVRWMCPTCIVTASDPGTAPHPAVLPVH